LEVNIYSSKEGNCLQQYDGLFVQVLLTGYESLSLYNIWSWF